MNSRERTDLSITPSLGGVREISAATSFDSPSLHQSLTLSPLEIRMELFDTLNTSPSKFSAARLARMS
jgi:hypothetical protein